MLAGLLFVSGVSLAEEIRLLGLGAFISASPYKGMDNKTFILPLFVWSAGPVALKGTELSFRFYDRAPLELRILAAPRMMGYSAGDSDALEGMNDREKSFDAGLGASLELPFTQNLFLEGKVAADISGRHAGPSAELGLEKKFISKYWRLSFSAGGRLHSARLEDYYFGVRPDEVRPDRPEYRAGTTGHFFAGTTFFCGISRNWVIMTGLGTEWLGAGARKSPLTGRDVLLGGRLGLARRF
jgi:outer membrane protein